MLQEGRSLISMLYFFNQCDEEVLKSKILENKRGNFWCIQNFKLYTRYSNKPGKRAQFMPKAQ